MSGDSLVRRKRTVLRTWSAPTACALALAAAPASAQDGAAPAPAGAEESEGLADIVVTARRVEERLQDVPASITAMSGEMLDTQRLQTVNQLIESTPGATFTSYHKAQQDFGLRGISSQTEGAAGDSAVATYVDNVVVGKDFMKSLEFFDVDHVEILRGPQGTSFGRNASAGVVHILNKRPTDTLDGFASVSAGNYEMIDLSAAIGGPIAQGMSARLSAHFDQRDGYTKDLSSDRDLDDEQNISVRGQLLFRPADNFELLLRASWSKDDDGSPVRRGQSCTEPYVAGLDFLGLDDFTEPSCNRWRTDINDTSDLRFKRRIATVSAEALWDISDAVRLTSITGYADGRLRRVQDSFGSPYALARQESGDDAWQLSQELRLDNSAAKSRFGWLVGLYLYTDSHFRSNLNDILSLTEAVTEGFSTNDNKTDSVGVFAQVNYDITERLNVTVGGRYSYDKKSFEVFHTATGALAGEFVDPGADPVIVKTSNSWQNISGSASLSYKVTDDARIYALVSQGYKAGGFPAEPLDVEAALTPYDEERSINYELGFKTEWLDRRLRLNGALFHVSYQDIQVADFLPSGTSITTNAGGLKVNGAELESTFKVNDYLTLSGSLSYLDTKLSGEVGDVSVAGNNSDNAPKWTGTVAADVSIPLSSGADIRLHGDYRGRTKVFESAINDEIRPGVSTVNGRISWISAEEKWEVSIWGRNLTDTAEIVSFGPVVLTNSPPAGYAPPRTFGATLRRNF